MKTDGLFSDIRDFRQHQELKMILNGGDSLMKQIKYMEFMSETQSRPESQIKEQLANELGHQPRQVSIWFQNIRARLERKQIEIEYNELEESYNALAPSFESLQRENQILLTSVQMEPNVKC